jgi:hypothetical protein
MAIEFIDRESAKSGSDEPICVVLLQIERPGALRPRILPMAALGGVLKVGIEERRDGGELSCFSGDLGCLLLLGRVPSPRSFADRVPCGCAGLSQANCRVCANGQSALVAVLRPIAKGPGLLACRRDSKRETPYLAVGVFDPAGWGPASRLSLIRR